MALNDFYTTCKCKICGSPVEEIPLLDNWGEHVMSKYECTNKECNMKFNECNDDSKDIDNFIEITYHHNDAEKDLSVNIEKIEYIDGSADRDRTLSMLIDLENQGLGHISVTEILDSMAINTKVELPNRNRSLTIE